MYGLQAEAHFDAAHFLTNYYGKCENLHGHRWRVVVTIESESLQGHDTQIPTDTALDTVSDELTVPDNKQNAPTSCKNNPVSCNDPVTMRDMVLDFGVFKRTVAEIADSLDHTFIVEDGSLSPATVQTLEAEGFTLTFLPFRTTAENLAHWFFEQLENKGLPVVQVEVDETPNNRAFYRIS